VREVKRGGAAQMLAERSWKLAMLKYSGTTRRLSGETGILEEVQFFATVREIK
jgi:hypothetical protein